MKNKTKKIPKTHLPKYKSGGIGKELENTGLFLADMALAEWAPNAITQDQYSDSGLGKEYGKINSMNESFSSQSPIRKNVSKYWTDGTDSGMNAEQQKIYNDVQPLAKTGSSIGEMFTAKGLGSIGAAEGSQATEFAKSLGDISQQGTKEYTPNMYSSQDPNYSKNLNKQRIPGMYQPTNNQFAMGGMNMQPNAEVEGGGYGKDGENTLNPDGTATQFNGPTHEQGGIKTYLDPGTLIFSDKIKWDGKTAAEHNKPYIKVIQKATKDLENSSLTKESKLGAHLNLMAATKASQAIFTKMEALKQAKVEAYAKKMGVNLNQSPEVPQEFAIGGVKLPMYLYGGDLDNTSITNNSLIASSTGQDPRYYKYQGNQIMVPGLKSLTKDKGVSTDIGLTNYNQLLNTRTQVRDSNSNVGKILPKFEYLNDPTKGSYDEQFNNYKKLYLPGFKYGGKKLPKYEDGGESEDNPLGYKPTNKVDQMRMQQALWNSQNKSSSSSWLTPEMMQTSSDALIEEGYTNPSSPVINTTPTANTYPIRRDKNGKLIFDTPTSSTNNAGSKRDQELYDEELARMNASGGRDSNKVDWKNTLGQVGNFAAQNAGNIYNLSRYNKPEVERYERAKATLLDPAAAIRNAMEHTRRAEYNVRGASGGNAGTYLSNRVALNAQNINMVDAIRQQYANANAGISNNFAQYNNQLAMQEVIANAQNRARTRSGKGEAIGSMGYNIANQMMDNKKTNMNQETLQLMMKYYDTPEFQRIMKEYKGKK